MGTASLAAADRAASIARVRADVERGKRLAAERFRQVFGLEMTRENARRVILAGAKAAAAGKRTLSREDI